MRNRHTATAELSLILGAMLALTAPGARAESTFAVQVNQQGAHISPTQSGIFSAEVERAGDAGLNARGMPVMDDPKNIRAGELSASGRMTFDRTRVFGSRSYYVFKLLGNQLGTVNLATTSQSEPVKLSRNVAGKPTKQPPAKEIYL